MPRQEYANTGLRHGTETRAVEWPSWAFSGSQFNRSFQIKTTHRRDQTVINTIFGCFSVPMASYEMDSSLIVVTKSQLETKR
ncbi:hypothetical protein ACFL2Q_17745 [Thermodesulfobacteriota bacterium]